MNLAVTTDVDVLDVEIEGRLAKSKKHLLDERATAVQLLPSVGISADGLLVGVPVGGLACFATYTGIRAKVSGVSKMIKVHSS